MAISPASAMLPTEATAMVSRSSPPTVRRASEENTRQGVETLIAKVVMKALS